MAVAQRDVAHRLNNQRGRAPRTVVVALHVKDSACLEAEELPIDGQLAR